MKSLKICVFFLLFAIFMNTSNCQFQSSPFASSFPSFGSGFSDLASALQSSSNGPQFNQRAAQPNFANSFSNSFPYFSNQQNSFASPQGLSGNQFQGNGFGNHQFAVNHNRGESSSAPGLGLDSGLASGGFRGGFATPPGVNPSGANGLSNPASIFNQAIAPYTGINANVPRGPVIQPGALGNILNNFQQPQAQQQRPRFDERGFPITNTLGSGFGSPLQQQAPAFAPQATPNFANQVTSNSLTFNGQNGLQAQPRNLFPNFKTSNFFPAVPGFTAAQGLTPGLTPNLIQNSPAYQAFPTPAQQQQQARPAVANQFPNLPVLPQNFQPPQVQAQPPPQAPVQYQPQPQYQQPAPQAPPQLPQYQPQRAPVAQPQPQQQQPTIRNFAGFGAENNRAAAINSNDPKAPAYKPAEVHYASIGPELKGDYKFGYNTGSGKDGSFREETRNPDGSVQGQYGYVDADGKQRIVKYTAGVEGFKILGNEEQGGQPAAPQQQAPRPAPAYVEPQPLPRSQNPNNQATPNLSASEFPAYASFTQG